MKIRYLSDIHLEFIKPNKIERFIKNLKPNVEEICVLAGDIGNPYSTNYNIFITFMEKCFKKIFIIAGNHEYYNKEKTMEQTNKDMQEYFDQFPNISFLHDNYEIYDNHCFIGTTLWSKITKPEYEINDVYNIPKFDYLKYNRLNRSCRDFLETTVENTVEKCVIITHHVPSNNLIDSKYKTTKMLPYNQWFYCDMDDFILKHKNKISCWIYGHTHTPACNVIHGIPFVCNPIGYPNENAKINWNVTLEI